MAQYRAQFESAYENVSRARKAVVGFARHWFSGPQLCEIELAIGEALANAAEHGAKGHGMINVEAYCFGAEFVVEVSDEGAGFERWDRPPPVHRDEVASRGYGMLIMRELMDDVQYSDRGRHIRLVKRLPVYEEEAEQALRA